VRVSAHLYNDQSDIDRLVDALEHLLRELAASH
jgi:selenocysteine lyase/cysteine desulfurase